MNVSSGTVSFGVGAPHLVSTRMVWVLRCLCLAGLGISTYLAWTAINMVQAYGCGSGEIIDCGHVLNSKWSKVMGMPVSMPACGLYASLLIMLGFVTRPAPPAFLRMLWTGLTAGAFMAGLAALWFIGLQIFLLKHICPYCVAVHSCGLVLTLLMLKNNVLSGGMKAMIASFAVSAVALLITIQVMTPETENFEVVRYPDDQPAVADEGDMFAPPEEIFEAPGDVFEAPGSSSESDLVGTEADGEKSDSSKPSSDSESTDSVKADVEVPSAAALLLIVPPRLQLISQMLSFFPDETATLQPAVSEDAATATAASTTTETKAAEEPKGDAKAEPTTDAEAAEKSEAATESRAEVAVPEVPQRKVVSVAGNRVSLDVKQWPLLGNADARYVFVEMFDYTCPHCRNTHFAVKGAFEHFGKDLAIIALPVPLEQSCNDAASGGGHAGACELSRIAITVWRVKPSKFKEFHDWMFESTRVPSTARAHAEKLVGAQEFKKEYDSKIPGEYIKRHVALYKRVGQGSVPKLLFPNSTINGEVNSKETLCRTIERELKTVAATN